MTVALLAIFVTMFVGAWITLEIAVRPGFERQERVAHQRDLERLQAQLDDVARDVASKARDYARWDDTYDFIGGDKPDYVQVNFDDEWMRNYGAHLVIIQDDLQRILWSHSLDTSLTPRVDVELAEQVARVARTIATRDGSATRGVVWTEHGPMMFGVARATRSDGSGVPRGILVMARRLQDPIIYEQLQLRPAFLSPEQPFDGLREHMASLRAGATDTWTFKNTRYSLLPLRNGEALVGAVLTAQRRDISELGQRTVVTTLAALTAMFACILGALWLMLQRGVSRRLARMTQHFEAEGAEVTPLPDEKSDDEIGRLTGAFNKLLKRLREAGAREQRIRHEREAAKLANRQKSDFLANISLELRTPLNAIVGYAELIEEDLAARGLETSRADLENITAATKQLLTLTNEVLDLARIESDRLELCPEAFRVDELMSAVASAGRAVAAGQANDLQIRISPDLGEAYTDHVRLRQCLASVLLNACKRTHADTVRMTARRLTCNGHDVLHFEIVDAGAPLSADEIEALFEPYVRREDIPSAGARLGLAVTRKVLGLMGGEITIACTECGCVFTVTVPAMLGESRRSAEYAAA